MGLRGTSRSRAPWGRVDQWPNPRGLRLSFGDSVRFALPAGPLLETWLAGRPAVSRLAGPGLLSWGCHRSAPPSASAPGVHSQWSRCSGELPLCASLRRRAVRRGATFGPELPPSGLVPPLPFLPAATVCSTKHFSGLLHPETDHGVRQVAGRRGLAWPTVRSRSVASHVPSACRSIVPEGNPARRRRCGRRARFQRGARWFPWRRGWVGGVLQPFPLALHPSKLFPRSQLHRVIRFTLPHSSVSLGLGEPSPRGLPACGPVRFGGPPRFVPSRRWSRVTRCSAAPRAERPRSAPVPFPRPQGFDPSASPLRHSGIAAGTPPDAPLGFAH